MTSVERLISNFQQAAAPLSEITIHEPSSHLLTAIHLLEAASWGDENLSPLLTSLHEAIGQGAIAGSAMERAKDELTRYEHDLTGITARAEIAAAQKPAPGSIQDRKEHHGKLVEIFNPLGELAARQLMDALQTDTTIAEIPAEPVAELPYAAEIFGLPPDLFGDNPPRFTHVSKQTWALPSNPNLQLVLDYLVRKDPARARIYKNWWDHYQHLPDEATDILLALHKCDVPEGNIEPEIWRMYRAGYSQLEEQQRIGELEIIRRLQVTNTKNKSAPYAEATHAYTRFVAGHADIGDRVSLVDTPITPIGDYGEAFARRLNAVARLGVTVLNESLEEESRAVWRKHSKVLRRTSRGMDYEPPKRTVQEGWISMMQVAAQLTGQYVEGRDNPSELLQEIVEEGLIQRVTELLPMGLLGPLTLQGRFYPRPLQVGRSGRVELRPAFEQWLMKEHAAHMKITKKHRETGDFGNWGTGRICPVAGKDGAMGSLSRAFAAAEQKLAASQR